MVHRVSWMSPIDYHILEFFEDHDITASPKVIAYNIGYDQQYCSKRCRVLEEHGILKRPETGLYELTEKGRNFIFGDLDPSELENEG